MTDFREMARAAKAKADADKVKLDADKAAADQVEIDRLEVARAFIVTKVVPLLDDAKRAFELEGVGCVVAHQTGFAISYSVTNIKPVYVATFQCYDLSIAHPAEYDGTRGGQVRFEHDGSDLKITRDWEKNYSRTGEFPDAVVVGAQAALQNYLEGRSK